MDYEAFMKIIRGRRSIRFYRPDPVDDETISQIIEAGKWAPSGNNTQPFEIVLVNDKNLVEQVDKIISEAYQPIMAQKFGAPTIMLVLGDPRFCDAYPQGFLREEILHSSLSAAIENMMLASTVLGLGGSVWKSIPFSAAVKIKDLLEIPQLYVVKAMLPIGYPKKDVKVPPKRDPIIHKNRYDKDKFKNDEEVTKIIKKFSAVKQLFKLRNF
ncbi:MAG: nitroreductase family protein [Deltaproteobacteria bacterium]|nr:nitroreductase family protein [Deltaproteobacteria bacterium]